jgi:PAS domain S-box-containing protein
MTMPWEGTMGASGRARRLYLAANAVVLLAVLALRDQPEARGWVLLGTRTLQAGVVGFVVFAYGLRRTRFWRLIGWSLLFAVPAHMIWYGAPLLGHDLGSPSLADALYVPAYCLLLAATLALSGRLGRLNTGELFDAAMVAVGACIVFWVLAFDPLIFSVRTDHAPARLVALIYPAIDVALVAVVGRMLIGSRDRSTALRLVLAAVVIQAATDLTYSAHVLNGTFHLGGILPAGYVVEFALLGAAILHPSAIRLGDDAGDRPPDRRLRLVLTWACASIGPALLLVPAVRNDSDAAIVALIGSLVLIGLTMARLSRLIVDANVHRATEERLRTTELRYRALVEAVPGIVYMANTDYEAGWSYVSPRIELVLGYTPAEWLAHRAPWETHVHPEDIERAREDEEEADRTGRLSSFYRMATRDGRTIWIHDQATLVPDAGGGFPAWLGLMTDITWMKEAEEHLRRAAEERRMLLDRVVSAQEEERRRLAGSMHDDPIQQMTAVGMRLASIAVGVPEDLTAPLDELQLTVSSTIARLRRLTFELRPPALDRVGLAAALRDYTSDAFAEDRTSVTVQDDLTATLSIGVRTIAYRIAQEALANAQKHAGARRVSVQIGSMQGGVVVRIVDDGVGFEPPTEVVSPAGHLGLTSMRERAELASGWLRIGSEPGRGTSVEFWLPDAFESVRPEPAFSSTV